MITSVCEEATSSLRYSRTPDISYVKKPGSIQSIDGDGNNWSDTPLPRFIAINITKKDIAQLHVFFSHLYVMHRPKKRSRTKPSEITWKTCPSLPDGWKTRLINFQNIKEIVKKDTNSFGLVGRRLPEKEKYISSVVGWVGVYLDLKPFPSYNRTIL